MQHTPKKPKGRPPLGGGRHGVYLTQEDATYLKTLGCQSLTQGIRQACAMLRKMKGV